MWGLFRALSLGILVASLPPEELEALRDIFEAAKLPWDEEQDPCTFQLITCSDDINRLTRALLLSSLRITWLPDSIGQLRALRILDLTNNQLVSLPDSIAHLKSLRQLDLDFNHLERLPDAIADASLEVLDLSHNRLTFLPESVGQLRSLHYLHLNSNQLVALPESIGNLGALRFLDLCDNNLNGLPDSIGQMQSLVSLYVMENQLTSLPESLGQLRNISTMDLGSNRLTRLPDLGDLQSLRKLMVNNNSLTSLPESIGQLALSSLYLQNNHLTSLPESMGNLKRLTVLNLASNVLTSLPGSMTNLKSLRSLYLDSNRLTSLPPLTLQQLSEFRAAHNRLTDLPYSFLNKSTLRVLSLHDNFMEEFSGSCNGNLGSLRVALLHSNRLSDPASICRLGLGDRLRALYLHANQFTGEIPPCLDQFTSLEVLTMHHNVLTGPVPKSMAKLSRLSILTFHGNQLYGKLPEELASAPSLTFLSAHSNRLVGPIPPLKLLKDCVDDDSFLHEVGDFGRHASCDNIRRSHMFPSLSVMCKDPHVAFHCPKTCLSCSTASARGPVLLLHDNRLSCSLPQHVTGWPKNIRSISLVGNTLGNGTSELPPWIHQNEHQPFLYISGNQASARISQVLLLASIFGLWWLLLFGTNGHRRIWSAKVGSDATSQAHRFLLQMVAALSIVAAALFVLYFLGATYYVCGDVFSSFTLSDFSTPDQGVVRVEWALAILWAVWIALGAFILRGAPAAPAYRRQLPGEAAETKWAELLTVIYSFCWLCVVAILSFPSMAYAVVSAIPFNNTLGLSAWWLKFFHYQGALLMVLVDMFITPKVVTAFSAATGMRRSMLLMAARLGTMWLAAVLSTLLLTTHCMNGWTYLWKVCDETTEDYKLFNISLGSHPILEPKLDLCSAKHDWWRDSACARSVVHTMAPLLVSKMVTRAFLQPILTLLKWNMSQARDGQLYMLRGIFCTSGSLEHGQQASLLVTMAEVALLWGALVPILLPAVLLATGTNMLMCKVGHGHFAVAPVMRDKAEAGMSRRYLHGTLSVLVFFQNWFAWSSGMHGRWLLLIAALLYMCELMGLLPQKKRRQRVAVLDSATPSTEG